MAHFCIKSPTATEFANIANCASMLFGVIFSVNLGINGYIYVYIFTIHFINADQGQFND